MRKNLYTVTVLAVFSILFWSLPSYFDESEAFQNLTLQTRDVFFKIRRLSTPIPDQIKDVVIVTIDEESCEKLQARWPWSRILFAQMIDSLSAKGARVVGLNVSFTGLEADSDVSTQELSRAMRDHGNVVIGATFDKENHLIRPNALIADSASRFGYLEKIVDSDFSIRRSYFLRPYFSKSGSMENFEGSFPLQILAAHSGPGKENDPRFDSDGERVTLGINSHEVFLNGDGSYTINYLASESDFTRIPAWKIVQGKVSTAEVKGKVVLTGLTSSLFSDIHQTPYGIMSGIGIHANEFLSVISGRQLRFVPDGVTLLISWLVSLCVLALFLFRNFWLGAFGFVVAFFGLLLGSQTAFAGDVILEPFPLIFGPFLATLAGIVTNSLKLLLENKGLETKVIQDKMTGLYTYEFLRARLEDEWKRCQKSKLPISIVMTDLDRFKKINDTLGHEVGNEMIKRTAAVIKESVRGYDIVSRYGGDEFVILLWHATFNEAKAYRDRLRQLYEAMAKKLEPALQDSSISIGIASFDPSVNAAYPADTQGLVVEADKDLFLDKESRRKGSGR